MASPATAAKFKTGDKVRVTVGKRAGDEFYVREDSIVPYLSRTPDGFCVTAYCEDELEIVEAATPPKRWIRATARGAEYEDFTPGKVYEVHADGYFLDDAGDKVASGDYIVTGGAVWCDGPDEAPAVQEPENHPTHRGAVRVAHDVGRSADGRP